MFDFCFGAKSVKYALKTKQLLLLKTDFFKKVKNYNTKIVQIQELKNRKSLLIRDLRLVKVVPPGLEPGTT